MKRIFNRIKNRVIRQKIILLYPVKSIIYRLKVLFRSEDKIFDSQTSLGTSERGIT